MSRSLNIKRRVSIIVSPEVVAAIDRLAGPEYSRSAFIEQILRRFLDNQTRADVRSRDLKKINRNAVSLNREAADVLEYQG